jgi:two-component system LytT family response regulator
MTGITKYRTLIADDEPHARERLRMLLDDYKEKIQVIVEAKDGTECREMIDNLKPDLVFLDIQMPGLSGFEVLKEIQHSPVIIFCTAYDQYALQAFETNSIDYLVKPVKAERLQKSIDKLDSLFRNRDRSEIFRFIDYYISQAPKKEITSLPVRLGDRMIFIRIEEIAYFEAEEKYVTIHTRDGKKHISDSTLKSLEEKLGDKFLRIQRSLLVNGSRIKEIDRHFGGRYILRMDDHEETKLMTGKNYSGDIKRLMEM